jgi:hypothetical protein
MNDRLSKFRFLFFSLFGVRYRELPFGTRRKEIVTALSDLSAEKCGGSGTPAFEVNNEYFRIGRQKVRICTEDGMFVSLWGPKRLVDDLYEKIIENVKARLECHQD